MPQPKLAKTDSDLVEAMTQANIDNDKIVKVFTTLTKGRKADALRQAEIPPSRKRTTRFVPSRANSESSPADRSGPCDNGPTPNLPASMLSGATPMMLLLLNELYRASVKPQTAAQAFDGLTETEVREHFAEASSRAPREDRPCDARRGPRSPRLIAAPGLASKARRPIYPVSGAKVCVSTNLVHRDGHR